MIHGSIHRVSPFVVRLDNTMNNENTQKHGSAFEAIVLGALSRMLPDCSTNLRDLEGFKFTSNEGVIELKAWKNGGLRLNWYGCLLFKILSSANWNLSCIDRNLGCLERKDKLPWIYSGEMRKFMDTNFQKLYSIFHFNYYFIHHFTFVLVAIAQLK